MKFGFASFYFVIYRIIYKIKLVISKCGNEVTILFTNNAEIIITRANNGMKHLFMKLSRNICKIFGNIVAGNIPISNNFRCYRI